MKRLFIFFVLGIATFPVWAQDNFFKTLADSAATLTRQQVIYDPDYFSIGYPNGDVPANKGVCTEVVIRAYRKVGIDLQQEVHEDMHSDFSAYPKIWGLKKPVKNIDHRRVPNLMIYFERQQAKLAITIKPLTTNQAMLFVGIWVEAYCTLVW